MTEPDKTPEQLQEEAKKAAEAHEKEIREMNPVLREARMFMMMESVATVLMQIDHNLIVLCKRLDEWHAEKSRIIKP